MHSDFATTPFTMNIISAGTNDIISGSWITITVPVLSLSSESIKTNQTLTYNLKIRISFIISTQNISIMEWNSKQIIPDLAWFSSSLTAITYSLGTYSNNIVPSWIALNSSTGELNIVAPDVSTDTNYYFTIITSVAGFSSSSQKLIILTVTNWFIQGWEKYSSPPTWAWILWDSDHYLSSGSWIKYSSKSGKYSFNFCSNNSKFIASKISNTLNKVILWVIGITTLIVLTSSLSSSSSISSLWSMLNQNQLFFLLFLMKAYIPIDVENVIIGPIVVLNPYIFLPFSKIEMFNSAISNFNFALTNPTLDKLKIKSDGSIYNISSYILFIIVVVLLHWSIFFLSKWASRCRTTGRCSSFIRWTIWITSKLMSFLTFGFYIRSVLEINQYILVSSVNEVKAFNTTTSFITISFAFACLLLIHFLSFKYYANNICNKFPYDFIYFRFILYKFRTKGAICRNKGRNKEETVPTCSLDQKGSICDNSTYNNRNFFKIFNWNTDWIVSSVFWIYHNIHLIYLKIILINLIKPAIILIKCLLRTSIQDASLFI